MVKSGGTRIGILVSLAVLGLVGCAGSPVGDSVQRSLEADSQLAENPPFGQGSSPTPSPAPTAADGEGKAPAAGSAAPGGDSNLRTATPDVSPTPPTSNRSTSDAGSASAIQQAPTELRRYLTDLSALGLLSLPATTAAGKQGLQPNGVISRGDYAQWLLATNNRFYQDQLSKQVRPGSPTDQPVFQDVPSSHPEFSAIQGLAEAGLIPSALTGNSTAINFRPEDPLTRQTLILWKVPLDTRAPLPAATVQAVAETWGFQDGAKIEPLALRAVLADFQAGEFSNIRRAFGYTTLFQPNKAVTQAEAAAVLWRFGSQTEAITAAQLRQGNGSPASNSSDRPNAQ